MSADNEIAILHMKDEKKYYVAMVLGCPSIEEVECDETWQKEIKDKAIRDKRVFDNRDDAFDSAIAFVKEEEEDGGYVEYGITSYTVPHVPSEERFACECGRCHCKENRCPVCGNGITGKDALCDKHYSDYLGTHCGGRSMADDDDAKEYKEWVEAIKIEQGYK